MSPRLAARAAVVCIVIALIAPVASAHAERRPVAVIDLSDTPAGKALAAELGNALNNHAELKPVDNLAMAAELMGELVDEDARRIEEARRNRATAEEQFDRREFAAAAATAAAGQTQLSLANPTPTVLRLFSELAFVHGEARLGERKPDEASALFRLAAQLDPEFAPNPARTFTDVIQAFQQAKAARPGLGTLMVTGTGRVVVDGREAGLAPVTFEVSAGLHVVWLVGAERDPRAKLAAVTAGQPLEVAIDDAPTSEATKVRRARMALQRAPDASARAAAMQQIVALLDVRDAVLLTSNGGKLVVQTWRDQAPGFSALREHKSEKPAELLEPLAPRPKIVVKPPEDPPIKIPVVEKAWYEKPRYWGLGFGATTAILIGVVWALNSWDRTVPLDRDPQFRGLP